MAEKEKAIVCRAVIEMMGAPKEHIVNTLKTYINKLKEDKDYKIIAEEYAEPEKKSEDDKLYITFVELEFEIKGIDKLVWFCFDYLPSSVDIISPDEVIYDSKYFTDFLNDLQSRMHSINMKIASINAENEILKSNGMALLKNIIKLILKQGKKDIKEISRLAGIPEEQMTIFMDSFIKEGKVKKEGNFYQLP